MRPNDSPRQTSKEVVLAAILAATFLQRDLRTLEVRAKRSPNAANTRALADGYLASRRFGEASEAFARAGAKYAALGDPNAAKVLRGYADRYRTTVDLFAMREPERRPLAKFEPAAGCYLGAFIDREDALGRGLASDDRRHGDPDLFAEAIGKPHAVHFTYVRLGARFPKAWIERLWRSGSAAHIALEPTSLVQGSDPDLLRRFAEDLREVRSPVFVRFASEMNGAWTRYGGDPAGYRRMFAAAAAIIREEAPNAAMVWCPNDIPEATIDAYYPGAQWVDWVGVNFYSVVYNDGDRAKGAAWRNPLDSLAYIYRKYAARHPMMVGEWAATHRSVVDGRERADFAREKIGQFYGALGKRYPRVKAVHWLSMDTMRHAMPGRQLNDYSLLGNALVARKYSEETSSPYYLSRMGDDAPFVWRPVGRTASPGDQLSIDARSYVSSPTIEVRVNGALVRRTTEPGEIVFPLPEARTWTVDARVFDDRRGLAAKRIWKLTRT